MSDEKKEPAEWILDAIASVPFVRADDPAVMEKIELQLVAFKISLPWLLMAAIVRDDLMRKPKYSKLRDTAWDLIRGIEAGHLPDPSGIVKIARKYVEDRDRK